MNRSPLGLHMPDADALTGAEVQATLDLAPAAMLCLVYAQWDEDKGVAADISNLARTLGHDRLYVRFHADPHPPGYARTHGGPEAWGRLCAKRMGQYYGLIGVQLHAILANETDADYEGGFSPAQASDFYRRAIGAYEHERPQDILHVPAPTGAPSTHREHLEQYQRDGWLQPHYWIDGHGYDGDLENVLAVITEVCPGHEYVITETNDLADFDWPIELLRQGRVRDICYFTLNWARGGEGRIRPPTPDDAAKRMSLLRFPDRYAQFKATIATGAAPPADPPVEPIIVPTPDPWQYFTADQIAAAAGCPVGAVAEHFPRIVAQLAACGINDRPVQVAAIGTVAIETASEFEPIHEYGTEADWAGYGGGATYAGRGFIQLTHDYNYRAYGQKVNDLWAAGGAIDLVARPDDALDPDVAAAVLAVYFRDHGGDGLARIPVAARAGDWQEVRRLVQGASAGLPRLIEIAAALDGQPAEPVEPTRPVYDPSTKIIPQNADWDCAEQSTLWAMTAFGRHPDDSWMEGQMLADHIESTAQGLLDGSGKGLAQWINDQYGEFGYWAYAVASVSFDDIAASTGKEPLLIGGHRWGTAGHWSGVRRYDPANQLLELANPAHGYGGIYQTMSREQFEAVAPVSLVAVMWGTQVPAPPDDEAPALRARITELEAQVADKDRRLQEATSRLGYAAGDLATQAEAITTALRSLQPTG